MMYHMTKIYWSTTWCTPCGRRHRLTMVTNKSQRYLKLFSLDFPWKIGINDVSHDKKNIYQLLDVLDVLDLDLIIDVHHGYHQVLEVPKTFRFPFKKNRYKWCITWQKKIDQLLDVLDLDHGDQQVPEVPKTILTQSPLKKKYKWCITWQKKDIDKLLDVLDLDLILDVRPVVHHGDNKSWRYL